MSVANGFPLGAKRPLSQTLFVRGKKMKALVKQAPEPLLWLEEVAEPRIGFTDVIMSIDWTAN